MIGHGVMHFTFLDEDLGSTGRAQARDCVALGLIASTAAAIRTFERRETAHLHPERSATTLLQTFAVCLAVMLCVIALALDLSGTLLFVVTYGLGMLLAVVVIRRMRLGIWGGTAIAVTALLVAIAIIGGQSAIRHTDFTLAFALQRPGALISTTQRILADAPWTGTGAGTFASLLPIYIDAGDIVADAVAPTTASNAAITLGRPMDDSRHGDVWNFCPAARRTDSWPRLIPSSSRSKLPSLTLAFFVLRQRNTWHASRPLRCGNDRLGFCAMHEPYDCANG
jgi:hypothetical protein